MTTQLLLEGSYCESIVIENVNFVYVFDVGSLIFWTVRKVENNTYVISFTARQKNTE